MKSYSNEIPNISTDELKKNIKTGEESHLLILNNLEAIRQHDQKAELSFKRVRRHQWINTILLILTLGAAGVSAYINVINLIASGAGS